MDADTTAIVASSSLSLAKMDASQIRAATYAIHTPLLLQAGAGSGKTQTMATRIAFLLESGVAPRSILGICFTRQAAETLRERVQATLPPSLARHTHSLKLKTFHAFGLECLRRFGNLAPDTSVIDSAQQYKLCRLVVEQYAVREKSKEAVAELVEYVNRVKMMKVPPITQSNPAMQDAFLYPHYQRLLHDEHNSLDFGDLQQMFYDLLRPIPADASAPGGGGAAEEETSLSSASQSQAQQQSLRLSPSPVCAALRAEYTHIVVDEFQDFNEVQVELLALLAGDACRVTCVGDPNQCIYTWRGALPNVFEVWKRRFPQAVQLTLALNYRSDGPIVEAANKVVRATQIAHHHREERAVTLVQCPTEDEELQAVPLVIEHLLRRRDPNLRYGDIAILCRSRRRVQLYCNVLHSHRIPVRQLKAVSVDSLATMRSLMALLRLCLSPHSREGDGDVRTVLSIAPLHRLPAKSAKSFLLSLASVCQERRDTEAAQIRAWRHTMDVEDGDSTRAGGEGVAKTEAGGGCGGRGTHYAPNPMAPALGVHPESHSFFAVLQELVYHNFSEKVFAKLEVPKKGQKTIRHMVQLIVHAKEMLQQPSCDVEQVLRYVLREGGYESESTSAVATRAVPVPTTGQKRQRGSEHGSEDGGNGSRGTTPMKRVGALLMEQCAAEHNSQQQQQQQQQRYGGSSSEGWRRRPTAPARRANADNGGLNEDDVLPPEEEAAVWEEQRMNLPELVLHTYRTVHEALQREVALQLETEATADVTVIDGSSSSSSSTSVSSPVSQRRSAASADNSMSVFSSGSGAGTQTVMQSRCPPPVVLRRVLDEFVSLVASDDYGPMREGASATADSSAAATTQWIGQVTVGTVHRAKGMEWPAVLLPGCWVGEYPVRKHEEERRVFYVAMSRAMKHLVCFTASQREGCSGPDGKGMIEEIMDAMSGGTGSGGQGLVETPYLAAVGEKLERVSFNALKQDYLKEHGYI